MMRYQIHFDFDCEGEPPTVYIYDNGDDRPGTSGDIIEVLEDPDCLEGEWSWEQDDWEPGPTAAAICKLMNEHMEG